jgi:DNA-directed RNA polymerase specialized sigma24 family protein
MTISTEVAQKIEELLSRLRCDDAPEVKSALLAVLKSMAPEVKAVLRNKGVHPQDLDECFNDVTSKFECILTGREGQASLRASTLLEFVVYIFRMAQTVARDYRNLHPTEELPLLPYCEAPIRNDFELEFILLNAISVLPRRMAELTVLLGLEGQTYEEAAQKLRCGVETVKKDWAEARRRLRIILRSPIGDREVHRFFNRPLKKAHPYVVLAASPVRVENDHTSTAIIAAAIDGSGTRSVLAVEAANDDSKNIWHDCLRKLIQRGLRDVRFIVSEDYAGIREATRFLMPDAVWQQSCSAFLRRALKRAPPKNAYDHLLLIFEQSTPNDASEVLIEWCEKWKEPCPDFVDWVMQNIEPSLNFYQLPEAHGKWLKSERILAALNDSLARRFPQERSECKQLRDFRLAALDLHFEWMNSGQFVEMTFLPNIMLGMAFRSKIEMLFRSGVRRQA